MMYYKEVVNLLYKEKKNCTFIMKFYKMTQIGYLSDFLMARKHLSFSLKVEFGELSLKHGCKVSFSCNKIIKHL